MTRSPGDLGDLHIKMSVLATAVALSLVISLTEGNTAQLPRWKFTDEEASVKRIPVSHVPAQAVFGDQPGSVSLAGWDKIISLNFQGLPQKVDKPLAWGDCSGVSPERSNLSITVLHQTEEKHMFVCATGAIETACCVMDPAEGSSNLTCMCLPSHKMSSIIAGIRDFIIKQGEPSVLVENDGPADLYVTLSGSHENAGIYKFGENRVSPLNKYKEQYYIELVLSRRKDDSLQDKMYAFYNERNRERGLYSDAWAPFVSQVCLADTGGSKQILQFTWTSQMTARLFCGDPGSRQHFSQLVDVATVYARQWNDTRVYALFRNEWNMSAVCVYTIGDIDRVFKYSKFKDFLKTATQQPRQCTSESTKLSSDVLRTIERGSEMLDPVRPVKYSIFKHHIYTHISVDSPQLSSGHFAVLFLSLKSGGVHKVLYNSEAFVIAAYLPHPHRSNVASIMFHPSSRKLYVKTKSELVQLDVSSCSHYGDKCEDCVLARDPYCGWNGTHCTPKGPLQVVSGAEHSSCTPTTTFPALAASDEDQDVVSVDVRSRYFLRCPARSQHAQYVWHHPGGLASCSSGEEQCVFLIDSMAAQLAGNYRCVSTEAGYTKVIKQYQIKQKNRGAGHAWSPLLGIFLTAFWLFAPK